MDPLLFVDWRRIANAFNFLCWIAVLALAIVVLAHVFHGASAPGAHCHVDIARCAAVRGVH